METVPEIEVGEECADASLRPERPDAARGADAVDRPLRLGWTDPENGEELAVEMWGASELASDLVALGFEVIEAPADDESLSSLFVVIRQRVVADS